jgi:hypothetical protein
MIDLLTDTVLISPCFFMNPDLLFSFLIVFKAVCAEILMKYENMYLGCPVRFCIKI